MSSFITNPKRFNTKLALIITLAFAALVVILWPAGCLNDWDESHTPITAPKQIEKAQHKVEKAASVQLDSLVKANATLAKEAKQAKQELSRQQANARLLEAQLLRIRNEAASPTAADYGPVEGMGDDSASNVEALIESSLLRDSLCNETIAILERQVENRDNEAEHWNRLYSSTKSNLLLAIDGQKSLQDYNTKLRRQLKWKKAGNTIWKSTAVVLAGVLLHQQLK